MIQETMANRNQIISTFTFILDANATYTNFIQGTDQDLIIN